MQAPVLQSHGTCLFILSAFVSRVSVWPAVTQLLPADWLETSEMLETDGVIICPPHFFKRQPDILPIRNGATGESRFAAGRSGCRKDKIAGKPLPAGTATYRFLLLYIQINLTITQRRAVSLPVSFNNSESNKTKLNTDKHL